HIEIGIQFFGELQLHTAVDSAHVDAALAELRDTDLHSAVNSGDVRISHRLRDFDFSVDSAQTNRAFNLSDIHAAVYAGYIQIDGSRQPQDYSLANVTISAE